MREMRTDAIVLVVNLFAGWVMDVELDDSVNVSVSSDGERVIGDYFEGVLYPDQSL